MREPMHHHHDHHSKLAVLCDFDDTVIQQNLGVMLLERFGKPEWRRFHPLYLAGKMTLRQSITKEYSHLQASREGIEAFVRTNGTIRPGFLDFVYFCKEEDIPLTIVTSGLEAYVKPFLCQRGLGDLEMFGEQAVFTPSGIRLVTSIGNGACQQGNICKCFYLQRRQQEGYRVIYIGDGVSDLCPAPKADYIFARRKLLVYCQEHSIPHTPFETFNEVVSGIQNLREKI